MEMENPGKVQRLLWLCPTPAFNVKLLEEVKMHLL